jgi:SAM-dependent methyltransferase
MPGASESVMVTELINRPKYALLSVMAKFTNIPQVQSRHKSLKYLYENTLDKVAREFNLPESMLADQLKRGLDNPGYRFARDAGFFRWLDKNRTDLKGISWLDVGACSGCVSAYMSHYFQSTDMELLDIDETAKRNFDVKLFDGSSLDYPDNSFDIVMFSYVLHHAADDTIKLLKDAHRIARKYVLVLEDSKEKREDYYWAFRHDKRGTFRGLKEWRYLFKEIGFDIETDCALSNEIHSRHFFALRPVS